ncbi:hypothetical protein NP233_g4739 [Leucocoprinus birnbaumii]|uniref:Uncharacterized protein n=1 Tax=Leucocoprinus birnbaumii TaxID=56174 RepID=A0AAD5YRK5_9AGAR|nr:hypothetical protein NP233_g4739 [Leucocoprinus birnbaumii]
MMVTPAPEDKIKQPNRLRHLCFHSQKLEGAFMSSKLGYGAMTKVMSIAREEFEFGADRAAVRAGLIGLGSDVCGSK